MSTAARVGLGLLGGTSTLAVLWCLLIGYAFGSLCPPTFTPEQRFWHILEGMFLRPPMPVAMSVVYAVLNASLFLCVKAKAGPLTFRVNSGRHLLVSSALAVALMLLPLVPFLFRFG